MTTPTTGNLLYSEVEDDLRASVRALLDKRSSWDSVLARTETSDTTDHDLWTTLASEMGCAALAIPEKAGGAGASWREVAVVAEEVGRAVAPIPFLGTSIAASMLITLGQQDLLAQIASGEITVAIAMPFGTAPNAFFPTVEVRDELLHGSVHTVADAAIADVLLVPTDDALYAVKSEDSKLRREALVSFDMTRPLVDLWFDGSHGQLLAHGPQVTDALESALSIGAVVLASEQLGVAERCLEMAVEYLTVRRQFGRILGSYQALKHRMADLWVSITQARAVARYAAECAATGSPDLPIAAAMAKAHCSSIVQQVAEECVQLHGGIGFTWEHPAHLYLKRAKSTVVAFGSPDKHRALLAGLVNIPGAERK